MSKRVFAGGNITIRRPAALGVRAFASKLSASAFEAERSARCTREISNTSGNGIGLDGVFKNLLL